MIDVVGCLAAVEHLKPGRIISSASEYRTRICPFLAWHSTRSCTGNRNSARTVSHISKRSGGGAHNPYGALLLTHLAESYGPMPVMTLFENCSRRR